MTSLRDKVLTEVELYANQYEDFGEDRPKQHPSGWEIYKCENWYEFHADDEGCPAFYDWFPHSDEVEDRYDIVAEMLGIKLDEHDRQPN